ncbi:CBS domain-containing protein [Pseudonocardia sp. CA-107938]|uniref:CBS domain-containing protein n=1 Tax=Pseudonocardia sp. CA-107938 TaxID=3240021 RepID=UPI003D8AEB38
MNDEDFPVLVRDVMRAHPVTARPRHPATAAATLLLDHRTVAVPVVTAEGRLCGVVDETELVRGLVVEADEGDVPLVADLMTPAPFTAAPDDDLRSTVEALLDRGTRLVPVLDDERLVGVVTARDLVRHIVERAAAVPGRPGRRAAAEATTPAHAASA